jgi:membrane-bound serine protease (ClpP class)
MVLTVGLMVLGLALLAIELLVIPGFGVVGVLGIAAMVGSVWVAYDQLSPGWAGLAVVAGVVAGGVMFWLFPKTAAGKAMVLNAATTGRAGRPDLALLLGREGVVVSEQHVDVVTDGQYVTRGTKVRVVRVDGARVVVEPLS